MLLVNITKNRIALMMKEDYKVSIEDRCDYIFVRIVGMGGEVDHFVNSVIPAIELCKKTSHKKLLLEDAIEDDWSPMKMEKLVSKLFEKGFDELSISVYVSNPKRQFNTYYAQTVGRNMGMDVAVSIRSETAIKQLLDN